MSRVFLVMSANLAVMILCTLLFEQNSDLKELRGGGCWVEVEHTCLGPVPCPDLATPSGFCRNKLVSIQSYWFSAANATTTGTDFMYEESIDCLKVYGCKPYTLLGKKHCEEDTYKHNTDSHTNQDVDGEPCTPE